MTLAEATSARTAARLAWENADRAYQANPTRANRVTYDNAHIAHSDAKVTWARAYKASIGAA